jgi:hypothetical protein
MDLEQVKFLAGISKELPREKINEVFKFLKSFKKNSDNNTREIERLLKKYFEITGSPTINPDGTVDIEGDCILKQDKTVNQLPVKFGKVSGKFDCFNNQLTSLIGAPQSVGGDFHCGNNQLTSLEGAPQSVGGYFSCSNNQLTSLAGAPQSVGGSFNCGDNQLTSLVGAPQSVGGYFDCQWSPTLPLLRTVVAKKVVIWKGNNHFKEINDILNSSIKDNPGSYRKAAIDARRKLIDAGYEGNAKW